MRVKHDVIVLALAWTLTLTVEAQVPQRINYQGGVAVGGTAYHGLGYFKFAFISQDATVTFWSNDGTGQGGAEPLQGIPLVVYRGAYEVTLGDATLPNMQPVSPTVFANANVHLRVWFSDDNRTFQPVDPDTPMNAVSYAMVAATVPDGSITGDKLAPYAVTALNIAPASIGPTQLAANAAALSLRSSGGLVLSEQAAPSNLLAAGFTKLGQVQVESDQWTAFPAFSLKPRTTAVGVWTGTRFVVWGGRNTGWLSDGALYDPTTETWKPIASSPPPASTSGARSTWTGSELLVFGDEPRQHRRYHLANDQWQPISSTNAAAVVFSAAKVVVWTGQEVLIWGTASRGQRYDPATDLWKPMSTTNLASPVQDCAGVWTGSEMVVWGAGSGSTVAGLRYRPDTDTWSPMSRAGTPTPRSFHTMVWTGPDVIIWGGQTTRATTAPRLRTGGIYSLAKDTWRPMTTNDTVARSQHVAYWTGSEMLVWGGTVPGGGGRATAVGYQPGGARYNPKTDSWQAMSTQGLPETLPGATTAWTGKDLYVWGGGEAWEATVPRPFSNAGWRYRPATDSWHPLAGPPVGRNGSSAVWTGLNLIIWGGSSNLFVMENTGMNSGARFNPLTGRWYPISTLNAPSPRWNHRAVWSGREMIVWGGEGPRADGLPTRDGTLNTGGCYDPGTDSWRSMDTNGAPSARSEHSMTWTGTELLVFGGRTTRTDVWGRSATNTGGRYQPQTDTWLSLASSQGPSPRRSHAAAWTGTELIIWGGVGPLSANTYGPLGSGARYNPVLNTWAPMASLTAGPTGMVTAVWADRSFIAWNVSNGAGGRYNPAADRWDPMAAGGPRNSSAGIAAVWTGSEVLVWGGPGLASGSRYSPLTDTWTPMTALAAPKLLWPPAGVWADNGLLLFSGTGSTTRSNTTFRYSLTKPLYLFGGH